MLIATIHLTVEEVAEVASTNNYTEYLDKLVYDSHCMVRKLVAEVEIQNILIF